MIGVCLWTPRYMNLNSICLLALSGRTASITQYAWHTYTHMQTCTHAHTRSFPGTRGDKLDTKEAVVSSSCWMPVTAEQTLPQLCFALREESCAYTHTHTLRHSTVPKVCSRFFASFVQALVMLSLSPLIVLPKWSNGSYRLRCLSKVTSSVVGFFQLLGLLVQAVSASHAF